MATFLCPLLRFYCKTQLHQTLFHHVFSMYCNCNYILFCKLPRSGDKEGTLRSLSQAAAYPSVYHTRWRLHAVSYIAERQGGKLLILILILCSLWLGPTGNRIRVYCFSSRLYSLGNCVNLHATL